MPLTDTWHRPFPKYHSSKVFDGRTYDDGVFGVYWRKKPTAINYVKPHVLISLGDKDSGKGMTLDSCADKHLSLGHIVFMAQGAHDNEDLAMLRDPLVQLQEKRVLLLTGDTTEVQRFRISDVKFHFDQKPISRVTLAELASYDVILNVFRFYESTEEYYEKMRPLFKRLYERGEFYERRMYLKIGEAAEILNQNIQNYAEAQAVRSLLTNIFKQSRHIGITIGVATQRWEDVQKGARLMGDYYVIKALGMTELTTMKFVKLWSFFNADWLEAMPQNECAMMTDRGSIGRGIVHPATGLGLVKDRLSWHKEENENLLKIFGLEAIERKTAIEPLIEKELTEDPEDDSRHKRIILAYTGKNGDGTWKSMVQVEVETKVAHSVIQREIRNIHDFHVDSVGVCEICARTGCSYANEKVGRTRSEAAKKV